MGGLVGEERGPVLGAVGAEGSGLVGEGEFAESVECAGEGFAAEAGAVEVGVAVADLFGGEGAGGVGGEDVLDLALCWAELVVARGRCGTSRGLAGASWFGSLELVAQPGVEVVRVVGPDAADEGEAGVADLVAGEAPGLADGGHAGVVAVVGFGALVVDGDGDEDAAPGSGADAG